MTYLNSIILSLFGGILPAVVWLWFWLKEDKLHPEPRLRVLLAFLAGMVSVYIALPIEEFVFKSNAMIVSSFIIFLWATIEELVKFFAAYFTSLKRKVYDEPIDAVIYMITVALGFAALENALFMFNLIDNKNFIQSILTGNSRFLGATLLHTASSASIGIMMGLSYYKKPIMKKVFLFSGIIISIVLHTIFNLLIIKSNSEIFFVFAGIWVLIIAIILIIEKIKRVRPNK